MSTQYPPIPPRVPPQGPRRKSHTTRNILLGVGGGLVLLFGGCTAIVASAGSGTDAAQTPAGTQRPAAHKHHVGVGQVAKDGKFTFTITKVRKGLASYGDNELTREHAQGQFVILSVTVTNHGNESQLFDASDQDLFDAAGRKYSAESGMFTDNDVFLNEINPGNTVKGKIAFDMPKNRRPAKVVLHDSPFSGGVSVSLGGKS